MQHPFKHPLATFAAGTVLGRRRNGSPIYAIAGGNGEGEGASGSGGQSGSGETGTSGQGGDGSGGQSSDQAGQQSGQASGDTTDWQAEARKWEKRAKENKTAQDELATLKAANMTEQEKAVKEAEKAGRTAAAAEYAPRLAATEFRAAVAAAGVDLGEAADLIDTRQFVGADGEVDLKAIKSAVAKLSRLAPKGAGRSGADLSGGSGDQPHTLDKQIEEATKRRDFATVIRLKRQKAAQT
ncbi:hypothetical protein J7I98_04410 [Streptomyces sp. ISL-98]|uniref:hypothetical protein n=1 Tax=Streptomyces sp. ISL-98 TaxID=2819192 RepID=UPI001BE9BAB6|nr:hypothetical protein [Streptomyces sp. ISL-98]MBT2505151.1 hypothetical protein [Streptomyces sp. ISL-98]